MIPADKDCHLFLKNNIRQSDDRFIHSGNIHGLEKIQMRLAGRTEQGLTNIFMGNDGFAIFKYLVAKSVVPVIMRVDRIKDGKIRLFTDFFQHLVCLHRSDPGIYNNNSLTGNEKGGVGIYPISINNCKKILPHLNGFRTFRTTDPTQNAEEQPHTGQPSQSLNCHIGPLNNCCKIFYGNETHGNISPFDRQPPGVPASRRWHMAISIP